MLADAQSDLRRLSAAWARFNGTEPGAERGTRSARTPRAREEPPSSPAWSSCRCRGNRDGSWRGPRARVGPPRTATRSSRCSARRVPRRRGGSATRRSPCRGAQPPPRSPFPSARYWAGSSRPAPARSTTSRRAFAGWAASRSGRSSSPHAARWFRCCASAGGAAAPRAAPRASFSVRWTPALVDAARLQRPGRRDAGQRARARPERRRPRADPLRAHRHGRRDLPRQRPPDRGARAATDVCAPPPTSPRRFSRGSTAARSTRRSASPASSSRAPRTGPGRSRGEHAALIVRLDPPDRGDAWHLAVFAPDAKGELGPDRARDRQRRLGSARPRRRDDAPRADAAGAAPSRRHPPRPGDPEPGRGVGADDRRPARGSRPPASTCGCPQLSPQRADAVAAGVRRERRRRRSSARSQLANVRWSAVFDDVELTAADIARLAKEARPLIRSGGRWVALDRADLERRGRRARRARRRRRS